MSIERYSVIGIVFSAIIILLSLYLLKNRRITGGTFTRWFVIGLVIGVVSSVPAVLTFFYMILGTDVLISAVTAMSFMVLLLLVFYLDYRVNDLNDKIMKLAAKISANDYGLNKAYESKNRGEGIDEEEQI
jgi:hypothetical protein